MAVDVNGHLNRAVSHLVPNLGERSTGLNVQASKRVSQIMESDFPQSRLCEDWFEDALGEVVHLDRGFPLRTETLARPRLSAPVQTGRKRVWPLGGLLKRECCVYSLARRSRGPKSAHGTYNRRWKRFYE